MHKNNHINTVVFGQSSLEKPNAGKQLQQMRVLLIFSNNRFYKEWFYRENEIKHLRVFFSSFLTLWRPFSHSCITSTSLRMDQRGFASLYVSLCEGHVSPLVCVSPCIVSHCPCVTSPSVTDCCWCPPLPPPCNSPSEIGLLLLRIDFLWDTEYLSVYLQMIFKSSLILFLLMNQQSRLSL